MRKPIIGINMGLAGGVSATKVAYARAVADAGGLPILLPPIGEHIPHNIEMVDGLVFTGGPALDARRWGLASEKDPAAMCSEREDFDRDLMWAAEEQDKPVLAIGVGMQMLNVLMGGTLRDDAKWKTSLRRNHWSKDKEPSCHQINIANDSFVGHAYSKWKRFARDTVVSSQHQNAVNLVGHGLRVTARSLDNCIEAIESTTNWFAVGVQWHPELLRTRLDQLLFTAFVEYIATQIESDLT